MITYLGIAMMLLSSCMEKAMEPGMDMQAPQICGTIDGKVISQSGYPIEHIKITVDWNIDNPIQEIKYSGSDGTFSISIYDLYAGPVTLTITLEDIDGIENGGRFETIVDTITLFDEGGGFAYDADAVLDYQLNHHSAS